MALRRIGQKLTGNRGGLLIRSKNRIPSAMPTNTARHSIISLIFLFTLTARRFLFR